MINKKKLWFVTLFSLILVLSIYYITMPEELLLVGKENNEEIEEIEVTNTDSDILVALRIEADKQLEEDINDLQMVLTDINSTVEEKNQAINEIKELNNNRSIEESLEVKIKSTFELKAFVKINNNQVRVVIASEEHDNVLANNIMRLIQEEFEEKMEISVKFQTS